jgi:hypothetical protein
MAVRSRRQTTVLILLLATDVTDPSGYYYFDQLNAGDYVVYIPSLNFASGASFGR